MLRRLRKTDIAALSHWLPPLAASLGVERWGGTGALTSAPEDRSAFLYVDAAGEAFLSYVERTAPTYCVQVDMIAVPSHLRRLGIGSRAALALEARVARRHKQSRVCVPGGAGLALYFWLRLGYRPLLKAQWPSCEWTSIWLERELR